MTLRVVVADDNLVFRRVISDVVAALPGVEVVGCASNGTQALRKVRDLAPDLLTLDLEMPELDGLETMDALRREGLEPQVIVVSALTRRGGEMTLRAMEKGAFDFITKPEGLNAGHSRSLLTGELHPRLRALMHRVEVRTLLRGGTPAPGNASPTPPTPSRIRATPRALAGAALASAPASTPPSEPGDTAGGSRANRYIAPLSRPAAACPAVATHLLPGCFDLLLIGVSTGGPVALNQLLPALPQRLGVPLLIVQHMPPVFTRALSDSLAQRSPFPVREALGGETLEPGNAWIAPGGRQLRVLCAGDRHVLEVNDDPPQNNCRPSVDYLFRSVAQHFSGRVLALILTGMGSDGLEGVRLLKARGAVALAQDEATCVVYGMPKAIIDANLADEVLPLSQIGPRISALLRRS